MKKVIIGVMLMALSAPIGTQDVDASRRVAVRANRNIVEMVGQAYAIDTVQALVAQTTKAQAILAQIISTYQGVAKALSNADPRYVDLLKTSFKADETTLKNLANWFNTVINGSSEQDFRRLENEVDRTICALNACRLVEALATRYKENGIAKQEAPIRKRDKFKAKLKHGKEWLEQEYKEHKNNKLPMLREKMEDARTFTDEILKTFDVYTATLEEVTNLRQAINNLYSVMNSYYSTSGTVDKYNAKDVSVVDENIEKLKRLSADYQQAIEEMTRPEFNGSTTGNLILRTSEKVFNKLDQIKETLADESAIQEEKPGFARKVASKVAEETKRVFAKQGSSIDVDRDVSNIEKVIGEPVELENDGEELASPTSNSKDISSTKVPNEQSPVAQQTSKRSFFGRAKDKAKKIFGRRSNTAEQSSSKRRVSSR
ncbi:MAG: hypothetical protein K6C34_02955 [Alphaproteobacteria bacterium]|nr:hypothetical protein [Alphaproteobacteria bacterium]